MAKTATVVGLGRLGCCQAVSLAYNGIPTIGIDIDKDKLRQLRNGVAPSEEPMLQEYLDGSKGTLHVTSDISALKESDITFIFVNTPVDETGRYSLDSVLEVSKGIGKELVSIDDYHLVVLRSTVMPGSTMGKVRDVMETESGKSAGVDFGICYCPEFTAVGDVIAGMEHPDFFLIGEHNPRAGETLKKFYTEWVDEPSQVVRMDPLSAEITKMAVNSYVSMKISFANNLVQICEGIGGNVDDVTNTISLDSRINGSYMTGGTSFGGPCFPQDNIAFDRMAADAETEAPLAKATEKINNRHTSWIAEIAQENTPKQGIIAILGVAYKEGINVITASQGIKLLEILQDGFEIICYDPMGQDYLERKIGDNIDIESNLANAIENADTAIITTRSEEITDRDKYQTHEVVLIDPWRVFDSHELGMKVNYIPLGKGDFI